VANAESLHTRTEGLVNSKSGKSKTIIVSQILEEPHEFMAMYSSAYLPDEFRVRIWAVSVDAVV
jgi:hypothetical protein